jgi:hypothetical protein
MREEQAKATADPYGMTNKKAGNRNRRSFDCASRDKAARGFALDDKFFGVG